MNELLNESYQNGIYWAALNAEQARERAANAELDYWIEKKRLLVAGMERTSGQSGTVDDGSCIGKKTLEVPTVAST